MSVAPWGVALVGPWDVARDGSVSVKFPWFRRAAGVPLHITGRRIDAPASPARARVPNGYRANFQASSITFPTAGCWKVTGRVGGRSLTFVTLVVKMTGVRRGFGWR